jgi:insertion element IS1 protein InsB
MNTCPHCTSVKIVKNGKTYYGKQNYKYRHCRRQSVARKAEKYFSGDKPLKSLLLERLSLRAICRIMKVSFGWLMPPVKAIWQSAAEELSMGELHNYRSIN